MGRAYEVRKASIAATGKMKSALYMKASKEIYMAAKGGSADPRENLALRSAIDKFKGQSIPKDVIERAIEKAQGAGAADYVAATYEGFGPGNCMVMVDTLSDNPKRAYSDVRAVFTHRGGKLGNAGAVSYNFKRLGEIDFNGTDLDSITDALILGDVDVKEVKAPEEGIISVLVTPNDFHKAEDIIRANGVNDFLVDEVTWIADQTVDLVGEEAEKYKNFVDALNEIEDVQNVYTNANA
ncbi:MAG: YebC/PmpR family DNA-binding transcriptional regulator [Bacilli bacterium]|jgi:YebC/PmpR family DNA-binding regulatory protein|nr:YebC/PmpR family DNA-binding transcriptional regulator [Bacilli bacterium]